jgi:hypothetical protein
VVTLVFCENTRFLSSGFGAGFSIPMGESDSQEGCLLEPFDFRPGWGGAEEKKKWGGFEEKPSN